MTTIQLRLTDLEWSSYQNFEIAQINLNIIHINHLPKYHIQTKPNDSPIVSWNLVVQFYQADFSFNSILGSKYFLNILTEITNLLDGFSCK